MGNEIKVCEKCGKPLKDEDIFCQYCGRFVPQEKLNEKAKKELEARSVVKENKATDNAFSIRVWGLMLMGVGFLCDIIGMISISSGSYGSFGTILTIGTISFFVGLVLTFCGRA